MWRSKRSKLDHNDVFEVGSEDSMKNRGFDRQRLRVGFVLILLFICCFLMFSELVVVSDRSWSLQIFSTQPSPMVYSFHHVLPRDHVTNEKQMGVKRAMMWSWDAYVHHAWGQDMLKPLSQTGSKWYGLALTMIDSMDTLLVMGLQTEYESARSWLLNGTNFVRLMDRAGKVNVFETTIRVLGGLLACVYLTNDPELLALAKQLADRLLFAFDTQSRVPVSDVHLLERKGFVAKGGKSWTAEAGTLQLEMAALSELLVVSKYEQAADHVFDVFYRISSTASPYTCSALNQVLAPSPQPCQLIADGRIQESSSQTFNGLIPEQFDASAGRFHGAVYGFGGHFDSYYEYLLKRWIQSGDIKPNNAVDDLLFDQFFLNDTKYSGSSIPQKGLLLYLQSMATMCDQFLFRTNQNGFVYVAEMTIFYNQPMQFTAEMPHLACFLPGVLALGHLYGVGGKSHLPLAKELTRTCAQSYFNTHSGLAGEITSFGASHRVVPNQNGTFSQSFTDADGTTHTFGSPMSVMAPVDDLVTKPKHAQNKLRPETIESLFVLYRVTGDTQYRDWGWRIFEHFELHSRVPQGGYASLKSVLGGQHGDEPVRFEQADMMESFWLGETLKYLYLLFDDTNLLSLNDFVFNTEAHPFLRSRKAVKR